MIPNLVEYEKFFKKKQILPIKPEIKRLPIKQVDQTSFLFNIGAIIFIFIGIYFLIIRNEKKEENKKKYRNEINKLYNEIISD
jgi:hypothetical protein|tara:strand:+ start:323 stop:571 length:249 start_codon:yes stop_codon:yes gene_type:complete